MNAKAEQPKEAKPRPSYQVVHPPNKLKDLAGGAARLDEKLLEKADAAVAVIDKVDLAAECVEDLNALAEAAANVASGTDVVANERRIFTIMHDLRGRGATFGYPLVARIASSMNRYLDFAEPAKRGHNDAEVIRAHVDAVRAVLMNKLKGELAQQICQGFEKITKSM